MSSLTPPCSDNTLLQKVYMYHSLNQYEDLKKLGEETTDKKIQDIVFKILSNYYVQQGNYAESNAYVDRIQDKDLRDISLKFQLLIQLKSAKVKQEDLLNCIAKVPQLSQIHADEVYYEIICRFILHLPIAVTLEIKKKIKDTKIKDQAIECISKFMQGSRIALDQALQCASKNVRDKLLDGNIESMLVFLPMNIKEKIDLFTELKKITRDFISSPTLKGSLFVRILYKFLHSVQKMRSPDQKSVHACMRLLEEFRKDIAKSEAISDATITLGKKKIPALTAIPIQIEELLLSLSCIKEKTDETLSILTL